jgi:hypothetical protein
MYCYVWEFVVRLERARDFDEAYGPEGDWAQFFRRDPAYVRTLLLRDRETSVRFVTFDFWSSRKASVEFRRRYQSEFEALDATFEAWTLRETHLGDFDVVTQSTPR